MITDGSGSRDNSLILSQFSLPFPDLSPHPDISPYILIEAKKSALLKRPVSIWIA
jgi:hypothetical protein